MQSKPQTTLRVLSVDAVDRMLADRIGEVYGGDTAGDFTGPDMNGYGMGWWVERDSGLRIAFGGHGATPCSTRTTVSVCTS